MGKSNARRRPAAELIRLEDPDGIGLIQLPGRHEYRQFGVGYIYVIEFRAGIIKVGRTSEPFVRIRGHAERAAPHGDVIVRAWVSIPHCNRHDLEKELIRYGRRHCTKAVRGEYFHGLRFADVVDYATQLPYEPVDPTEMEELKREYREQSKSHFERLPPPPDNFVTLADSWVGDIFGRRDDGEWYRMPIDIKGDSADALPAILQRIAELRGCALDEVLRMTWLDIIEAVAHSLIRSEALKLKAYALKTGQLEILETTGDALSQAAIVAELGTLTE